MLTCSKEEALARLTALREEMDRTAKEIQEMMEAEMNSRRENYNKPMRFDGDILLNLVCVCLNQFFLKVHSLILNVYA